MRTTLTPARLAALLTGAAVTVVLTACGGGATTAAPAAPGTSSTAAAPGASSTAATDVAAEHNDADVRFAQNMIPHHQQAVEMAALAADRSASQEVQDLAEQIRTAQDPEIATMTAFLQTWGAEIPAGGMAGMDHSGMGGMEGMNGMMTAEQMGGLAAASGAAFDRMFLEMMIEHHEGAITDAQTELAEGANPQAKELAQKIVDGQTAEITEMQQLLQSA
jgi:uncharacterized protein (DUF305 family)